MLPVYGVTGSKTNPLTNPPASSFRRESLPPGLLAPASQVWCYIAYLAVSQVTPIQRETPWSLVHLAVSTIKISWPWPLVPLGSRREARPFCREARPCCKKLRLDNYWPERVWTWDNASWQYQSSLGSVRVSLSVHSMSMGLSPRGYTQWYLLTIAFESLQWQTHSTGEFESSGLCMICVVSLSVLIWTIMYLSKTWVVFLILKLDDDKRNSVVSSRHTHYGREAAGPGEGAQFGRRVVIRQTQPHII